MNLIYNIQFPGLRKTIELLNRFCYIFLKIENKFIYKKSTEQIIHKRKALNTFLKDIKTDEYET